MTDKFIGYFRIVDACEGDQCPVCACLVADGRRAIHTVLYEHVTDPDTRRVLHAAWGFCSWHAWAIAEEGSRTGAAILFEDLLRGCQERLTGTAAARRHRVSPFRRLCRMLRVGSAPNAPEIVADYRDRRRCPVCEQLDEAEAGYADTIIAFANDPQFTAAYEQSQGLCVRHLVAVATRAPKGLTVDSVVHTTVRKWDELRADLRRFVAKHEYRSTEPITDHEARSPTRAAGTLAGLPVVVGNDMNHPAPRAAEGLPVSGAPPPRAAEGLFSGAPPDPVNAPGGFVRRKLELRVSELTRQLAETSARAAGLHAVAAQTIAELRAENGRLRDALETFSR